MLSAFGCMFRPFHIIAYAQIHLLSLAASYAEEDSRTLLVLPEDEWWVVLRWSCKCLCLRTSGNSTQTSQHAVLLPGGSRTHWTALRAPGHAISSPCLLALRVLMTWEMTMTLRRLYALVAKSIAGKLPCPFDYSAMR